MERRWTFRDVVFLLALLLASSGTWLRATVGNAVSASPSFAHHQIANDRTVASLILALSSDPDASVREHAAEALGHLGDRRAEKALALAVASDPNARVREHAAFALGQLGGGDGKGGR
jgi:HEAT repeat protein